MDITPASISKQQGLETLLNSMGWLNCELYVIGDALNDLPMISAFGGYAVNTARDAIKSHARKVFKTMSARC